MIGLSEGEKHFIRCGIAQDIHTNGCRRLQFRALSVETGVIPRMAQLVLDWGALKSLLVSRATSTSDVLAFGLGNLVNLWNACRDKKTEGDGSFSLTEKKM